MKRRSEITVVEIRQRVFMTTRADAEMIADVPGIDLDSAVRFALQIARMRGWAAGHTGWVRLGFTPRGDFQSPAGGKKRRAGDDGDADVFNSATAAIAAIGPTLSRLLRSAKTDDQRRAVLGGSWSLEPAGAVRRAA